MNNILEKIAAYPLAETAKREEVIFGIGNWTLTAGDILDTRELLTRRAEPSVAAGDELTFDQIEDAFPENGIHNRPEDGALVVSAQWLHDFARAIYGIKARTDLASPAVSQKAAPEAPTQPVAVKDALRQCGADTDYHGKMLFTVAQFDQFVSMMRPALATQQQADCHESCGYIGAECDFPTCKTPAATTASASQPLNPVEPKALTVSIAELDAWLETDGCEPLAVSQGESLGLILHELKRLMASASGEQCYCNACGTDVSKACGDKGCAVEGRATAPSQDAAHQPIKTWQERMPEHVRQIGTAASESPYKDAEIADLRAALAQQGAAHAANAGEDTERDAIRFRWLNEDHADAETREKARDLARRLGTSSYFAITRDIDAAIAASAAEQKGPQ